MVSLTIYVEGGGDAAPTLAACREGFAAFFTKVCPERRRPKVVACGSRTDAYKRFRTALLQGGFPILLVDSEAPVDPNHTTWQHLKARQEDGWDRPGDASDEQAHLMVQCMESWFLADRDVLAQFYGQGFQPGSLPTDEAIERIEKRRVQDGLKSATRNTKTKGVYDKTGHGFKLLALIDPVKLRAASPRAELLCQVVVRCVS